MTTKLIFNHLKSTAVKLNFFYSNMKNLMCLSQLLCYCSQSKSEYQQMSVQSLCCITSQSTISLKTAQQVINIYTQIRAHKANS